MPPTHKESRLSTREAAVRLTPAGKGSDATALPEAAYP